MQLWKIASVCIRVENQVTQGLQDFQKYATKW